MKKKTTQLIVLVGVLALLLICYLILTLTIKPESGDANQNNNSDIPYHICTVDQKTVHQIAYTFDGTEYTYTLKEDATGWEWNQNPNLPLNNTYFAQMVLACTDLTTTVKLSNVTAAQLVEYGLAESANLIRFTDEVNGTQTFRVGVRNSFNQMVYFCREGDLTTVYMVASTVPDAFAYTPYDLLKMPDLPTDITASNLVRLTLTPAENSSASAMTYTYYVGGKNEGETDVWYVSRDGGEGVRLEAEMGNDLSTALTTLAFSKVVAYTKEEQAALGLDTPTRMKIDYKVTQSVTDENTGKVNKVDLDKSFTLLLSNIHAETGLCYATVEGSPLTCVLTNHLFETLLYRMSAPIS